MSSEQIGLVGLGLMGSAIARRLLAAGFHVLGYDVDGSKRAALIELGGAAAASLSDIGTSCRTAVLAVFNTDQVEEVLAGERGIAGTASRIAIVTSTCDPERIAALAASLAPRGLALIEFPVSGTSAQVARGEALGLAAGDATTIEEADAVLTAICPRRQFMGAAGNGGRAKLAINLMLGLNRAAIAEGLALGEKLGLARGDLLAVARQSAAYSQVMDVKGSLWAEDRFEPPLSRVDQSLKDFTLMLQLGRRAGLALPFARCYQALLADCIAHGEGRMDNAIIINAIRRRTVARE